jgi:tripartite-type tricarboxylate transporter receptor subunit TctC
MFRSVMLSAIAVLGVAAVAAPPAAAEFPEGPVTFVVPFSPGGSNDIMARQLGQRLEPILGQPVVIENRPGAGATIGSEYVARQEPDGYTIMIASVTFTMNPAVQGELPFDPRADFAPVAMLGEVPLVIGARPNIPADTPEELFAYLREHSAELSYGATGVGSIQHFAGELLNQALGTEVEAIQYPGGAPAMTDVMGDRIEYSIGSVIQMVEHIKAGNMKGIAVTGAERSDALPDVPTLQEAGLEDYEILQWWGILAPAGTPEEIVSELNGAINEVLASQDMKEFMARDGARPRPMSPDEFGDFMQANFERWEQVAEKAGMQAESQ